MGFLIRFPPSLAEPSSAAQTAAPILLSFLVLLQSSPTIRLHLSRAPHLDGLPTLGPFDQISEFELNSIILMIEPTEEVHPGKSKLNWTKVLFDYHICMDAEAFSKWNRDMDMPNRDVLEKDIPRTRSGSPEMAKQTFRDVMRRIATFYCQQNKVSYQQGLLEVVFPFALLRRKDFPTKKCYAYFNSFMRKHFPKVLVQRVVKEKKELPHAMVALTLTECLLNYHYPAIGKGLAKAEVQMSLIVTQELLTVFAKGLSVDMVYQVYDYFINRNDPNYIFYMTVALFGVQEEAIQNAIASDQIHAFIRNFKKIHTGEQLKEWLDLSEEIKKKTPTMFTRLADEFRFGNNNLLTVEDLQIMLKSHEILANGILSVSIQEIEENPDNYVFVLLNNKLKFGQYPCITIDSNKVNLDEFKEGNTYVLAGHEANKDQELNYLIDLLRGLPHCRTLILKEGLVASPAKQHKCNLF